MVLKYCCIDHYNRLVKLVWFFNYFPWIWCQKWRYMELHINKHKHHQKNFYWGRCANISFSYYWHFLIISWRPDINLHKKHPWPKLRTKIIQVRNFFELVYIKGDFSIVAVCIGHKTVYFHYFQNFNKLILFFWIILYWLSSRIAIYGSHNTQY